MKNKNLKYHWYEEPDRGRICLKEWFQRKLVNQVIQTEKEFDGSVRTLAKKLKVDMRTIFRWKSLESKTFYIKDLKSVCSFLRIPYTHLEKLKVIESIGNSSFKSREKMIKEPELPFNLLTKCGAELVGYAMSDGCISKRDSRFIYASNDRKQLNRVKYLVNKIFGKVKCCIEREDKTHVVLAFPPTIGRALEKSGVPRGNKSIVNPKFPGWIKNYGIIEYLKAVFTDEANSTLRTIKTQGHKYWSILLPITHGRSIGISTKIGDKIVKILEIYIEKGKAISLGKLPKEIKNLIQQIKPPNLLIAEYELLGKLDIKCTKIKPVRIHRSKHNKFSCYWRFFILKNSIHNFYEKIGFCENTKKQIKFEQQFKFFNKFFNSRISEEDLIEYDLPRS